MTKSAKIFRKLSFLAILAVFNYNLTTLATEPNSTPSMPPLEEFLKDSETGQASPTETNQNTQKKLEKKSFFQRLKNLFNFKSKEQGIKTVGAESPNSASSQDDQESFIDLGDNKLKQASAGNDKDQTQSIDDFKKFQDTQSPKEQVLQNQNSSPTASPSSTKAINSAQVDSVSKVQKPDSNFAKVDDKNIAVTDTPLAVPALPDLQSQTGSAQQTKTSSIPNATVDQNQKVTDKIAASSVTAQSGPPSLPDLPKIAGNNAIPQTPKQETQVIMDPVDTAVEKPQSSTIADKSKVSQLEIPQLPEIPQAASNIASDTSNADANTNNSDIGKVEIPSLPDVTDNSTDAKKLVNAGDQNALATEESIKVPGRPEVPTMPLVPSLPPQASVETISNASSIAVADKVRKASSNTKGLSDLSKFVIDEAKVLLLPNDDVVLGELTEAASYEQMDFFTYSKLYESQLAFENSYKQRSVIDNFLKNYDKNFNKVPVLDNAEAADQAFVAVDRNSLFALRVLLDSNPLLQAKNKEGNTLLHVAVQRDNYNLSKFLIVRGVNLSSYNAQKETPLMISEEIGASDISRLLKSAKISLK